MNLEMLQSLDGWVIQYALQAVGALVLLLIAWLVAGWARRATRRGLERGGLDATLTKFFANTARYVVLVAAVLMALGVFGIETTSFAAVLAAAGFAVGMALSGTLSNFAAGIMLLTFRPFKVGDVVEVAGETGTSTSTAFSRAASDHARWCMTRSRQVQPLPVLPPAGMRRSLPMGPPSPPTAQR